MGWNLAGVGRTAEECRHSVNDIYDAMLLVHKHKTDSTILVNTEFAKRIWEAYISRLMVSIHKDITQVTISDLTAVRREGESIVEHMRRRRLYMGPRDRVPSKLLDELKRDLAVLRLKGLS